MLIQILEQVLNGLLAGAYYLLIALGLTLIFSLGGLVNLAHGAFYALGAYFAVKLADTVGFAGALVLSPIAVALIGLVVERLLFRRFYREDPALGLLLTFGLAMVAEQALRWIFGASPIPFSIPQALKGQIFVGDFVYSKYRLLMLAVAVTAVAGLWLLLRRTPFGRVVRAGVQNPDMVAALGISLAPYMASVVALAVGARRARRRAARGDLRRPSGDGRRHPHGVVRRRRDRRFGIVLGRGAGGADRRRRARPHRVLLSVGRRSVDVPADAARAPVPAARTLRRTDTAFRVRRRSEDAPLARHRRRTGVPRAAVRAARRRDSR